MTVLAVLVAVAAVAGWCAALRRLKRRDAFLSHVAHELRGPVAASRILVEVAVEKHADSEEVVELGGKLLRLGDRQHGLIESLLALAYARREAPGKEAVRVDLAVRDIVADLSRRESATLLAAESVPAEVRGERRLIEVLVANVVDNAVRHGAPGGTVVVRTGCANGRVELTVENQGERLRPRDVPGFFTPFLRRGGKGVGLDGSAGLGLPIAKAIAEAHGGTVTARPREGGGLVVTVRLPGRAVLGGSAD
ncbi:sensor histidine kinase [Salininema proteolyticum]|uniref:histidine kinase n=1 Tax=Salininema proteolyticum TaxID=1607685 RepID=A0ABV8U0Y3_9ACTN